MIRTASLFSAYTFGLLLMATAYALVPPADAATAVLLPQTTQAE